MQVISSADCLVAVDIRKVHIPVVERVIKISTTKRQRRNFGPKNRVEDHLRKFVGRSIQHPTASRIRFLILQCRFAKIVKK